MTQAVATKSEYPGNCTVVAGFLTLSGVCELFRSPVTGGPVSDLTVRAWMKERGMPYICIPGDSRDTIRFNRAKVLAWAKARPDVELQE